MSGMARIPDGQDSAVLSNYGHKQPVVTLNRNSGVFG